MVEEYFEYLASTRWIEALARELELEELGEELGPATGYERSESGPKGWGAARLVRELRRGGPEAILNGDKWGHLLSRHERLN